MGVSEILAEIDREIAQLQQARNLLAGTPAPAPKKAAAPKAAKVVKAVKAAKPGKKKKKRNLSPEGRARIAEAVKRRWELQRKAQAK